MTTHSCAEAAPFVCAPPPFIQVLAPVFPGQTNHHGTLFGGAAMALMDKAAFLAASRHGRDSFVTACCESVTFRAPIQRGDLAVAEARLMRVGKRSIKVDVAVWAEPPGAPRRFCTHGRLVLVANRRAPDRPLPPLKPVLATSGAYDAEGETVALAPALVTHDIVFPPQTSHYGTLSGADALAMMGRAAYTLASRRAHGAVLMAHCRQARFDRAVAEGALVELRADVTGVGRTSISITVELWSENLLTGARQRAGEADYVMVAVDQAGAPRPVMA